MTTSKCCKAEALKRESECVGDYYVCSSCGKPCEVEPIKITPDTFKGMEYDVKVKVEPCEVEVVQDGCPDCPHEIKHAAPKKKPSAKAQEIHDKFGTPIDEAEEIVQTINHMAGQKKPSERIEEIAKQMFQDEHGNDYPMNDWSDFIPTAIIRWLDENANERG